MTGNLYVKLQSKRGNEHSQVSIVCMLSIGPFFFFLSFINGQLDSVPMNEAAAMKTFKKLCVLAGMGGPKLDEFEDHTNLLSEDWLGMWRNISCMGEWMFQSPKYLERLNDFARCAYELNDQEVENMATEVRLLMRHFINIKLSDTVGIL